MKRQKVTYSPEFKLRTVMESFTRNGSIKDFCESRNIPTCTFYKWLEEYNKRKDAEKEAESASFSVYIPAVFHSPSSGRITFEPSLPPTKMFWWATRVRPCKAQTPA